jgi:hypothetical protein
MQLNVRITNLSQPIQRCNLRFNNQRADTFTASFRFRQEHMSRLKACLRIPRRVDIGNRVTVNGEEALLITLYLLATGATQIMSEERFGYEHTLLSRIKKAVIGIIVDNHAGKIMNNFDWHMEDSRLSKSRAAIRAKKRAESINGLYHARTENVCLLVDGWRFVTSRPGQPADPFAWGHVVNIQKYMYSGHKKVHNLLFLVVVSAYGLIVDFAGPFNGRHNDLGGLRQSTLLPRFRQALLDNNLDVNSYDLLGDAIFPNAPNIRALFGRKSMEGKPVEQGQNALDECTRAPVEHSIGKMTQNWKALKMKHDLKILSGSLTKLARCCCILTNALTLFNGGQPLGQFFDANQPFRLQMPTPEEYFDP